MLNVLVKVTIHANKTYEQYTEMEKSLINGNSDSSLSKFVQNFSEF